MVSSIPDILITSSPPLSTDAFMNCMKAYPSPPAAPAPRLLLMSCPICCAAMREKVEARRSNFLIISALAPFCGAKTAAAPCGPSNGLSTSEARITVSSRSHERSSIFTMLPLSRATDMVFKHFIKPSPQSLTALPPSPTIKFLKPFDSASIIISPTP